MDDNGAEFVGRVSEEIQILRHALTTIYDLSSAGVIKNVTTYEIIADRALTKADDIYQNTKPKPFWLRSF